EPAPVENPVEQRQDLLAEIVLEGLDRVGEGSKDHAVATRHLQGAQSVLVQREILGHAALALDAAAEGHGLERSIEPVGPLVIGTDEFLRIAEMALAELRAAMRTAIFEDIDPACAVAHHHGLIA